MGTDDRHQVSMTEQAGAPPGRMVLTRSTLARVRRSLVVTLLAASTVSLTLTGFPAKPANAAPTTSITTLSVDSSASDKRVQRNDKRTMQSSGKILDHVVAAMPEKDTKKFSTVGVTWSKSSAGTAPDVQIRTKSAEDGAWSDWETITDGEPEESDNGTYSTDPIYVGEASGVQVRALGDTSTELKDMEVALVDSPTVATDSQPETLASTTAASDLYPRPPIVTRNGWGANESWRCNERKMDTTVKAAVVHHTAGTNSYSRSEVPSILRGIYAYHTQTLGWCDIGYNFLVDKYGKIYEGRWGGITRPVHGSHATDWNTDTVGISFMGNYDVAKPPAVMMEAGAKLLAWKLDAFQRQGTGKLTLAGKTVNVIFRHGDVMSTACPGRYITSIMGDLRRNVQKKIGSRGPIWNAWVKRGGWWSFGYPHVAEQVVGSGRLTKFKKGSAFKNLYWHPSHGDHVVEHSIRDRYQMMGGTKSKVGWPVTDEKAGPMSCTRMNGFTKGRIVWSCGYGAWPLSGGFNPLWDKLGSHRGDLGVPKSEQYKSTVRAGMVKQSFSNGRMYYLAAYGSNAVYGDIGVKYRAMGSEGSKLGAPISSEFDHGNGRANKFEHGMITWTKAGGVKVVYN